MHSDKRTEALLSSLVVTMHQRQVEHVEPDHRLVAVVAMLVPQAGRRQDQVAALPRALLAIDRTPRAFALDDHAHGIGGVAVRRAHAHAASCSS